MRLPVVADFDINVGNVKHFKTQELEQDKSTRKNVDGYDIEYSFQNLRSQTPLTYTLNVQRNGQPVTNLEKYLGALGHSVILKERTLDYIHAHTGEMTSGGHEQHQIQSTDQKSVPKSGSEISFSTTLPEPGKYKIFTQFQHDGKVVTTDYVVSIQ